MKRRDDSTLGLAAGSPPKAFVHLVTWKLYRTGNWDIACALGLDDPTTAEALAVDNGPIARPRKRRMKGAA